MTGRAARPIEAILQDCADWYRVPATLMLAEVGPQTARFRVAGLPELQYFHGRLKTARYEAWLRLLNTGATYFDVSWRGITDSDERAALVLPRRSTWPAGWPPPLPQGVSASMVDTWLNQVDSEAGRPAAVALGLVALTEWITESEHVRTLQRALPQTGNVQAHARAFRAWLRARQHLDRFNKDLGNSPLDRMRMGKRHERDRLRATRRP